MHTESAGSFCCCRSAKVRSFAHESDPSDPQAVRVRIPLSLGARRNDLDKGGDPCAVYDVVFNTEVIEQVLPTPICSGSSLRAIRAIRRRACGPLPGLAAAPPSAADCRGRRRRC